MPQGFYFVIVIVAMTLIPCSAMCVLEYFRSKQTKTQLNLIRDLTNLAASKDLATYSNLHALSHDQPNQSQPLEQTVLNDEAAAQLLAKRYEGLGLDPNLAYARDEENPLEDFGGPSAFLQ